MNYAPLLYYLMPGSTIPGHALEKGVNLPRKEPTNGPDTLAGAVGALVTPCVGTVPYDLAYEPEHQDWCKCGTLWIGVDRRGEVRPDLFARRDTRPGHAVRLKNGTSWVIPPARLVSGLSGLPRRRTLKADGSKAWEVEEAYRSLSVFAEAVYNSATTGAQISQDAVDVGCGEALAINYRIGELEAIALGLIDDNAQKLILEALVDYPTVERILEAQKKSGMTSDS